MSEKTNTIKRPIISIDRASKTFSRFDGLTLLKDFRPYLEEAQAIDEATQWFAARTDAKPEVVYPRITKMVAS